MHNKGRLYRLDYSSNEFFIILINDMYISKIYKKNVRFLIGIGKFHYEKKKNLK